MMGVDSGLIPPAIDEKDGLRVVQRLEILIAQVAVL
jgi:hypothetical protein